ncbi:MAG: glutamate--tRNA ligase [Coriobacteriales bacterium]|jgi:glutamyl-tRNA synthetase|nr:glutamate--tRNA ligase [Coriobacteriales bacterium]
MTKPVRVRFAPSPTGNLHIGGARTAIYNWAFAKKHGGTFVLRIEDTDPERSTEANTQQIQRSLRWLGLQWDEGPGVGGSFGPYQQTQRFDTYGKALEQLKATGAVYPCFCTADELAAKRDAGMAAQSFTGYDRSCRGIDAGEAQRRIDAGEPHTWRLKVPLDHGPVVFDDLVFGNTSFPIEQLDDFILMRSDGTPTYNYVVCIDDASMQITHVIRGDDHLSNTPKQILVYEALGAPIPQFAHLSMILGGDGKRLSKRHGATSVEAYQERGFFPQALLNYLALLGWSLDGETTLFDAATLAANFSLERVSKNPAVFDETKLNWVNSRYLKEMGAPAFIDALLPYLQQTGFTRAGKVLWGIKKDPSGEAPDAVHALSGEPATPDEVAVDVAAERSWYEGIYPLVAERVKTLDEVCPLIAYLFSGPTVALDQKSVEKCLQKEGIKAVLDHVIQTLQDPTLVWEHAPIEDVLRLVPEKLGLKPKVVFQAVRVAVCGNMVSPPLFESLELLGSENTLARLSAARQLLVPCSS